LSYGICSQGSEIQRLAGCCRSTPSSPSRAPERVPATAILNPQIMLAMIGFGSGSRCSVGLSIYLSVCRRTNDSTFLLLFVISVLACRTKYRKTLDLAGIPTQNDQGAHVGSLHRFDQFEKYGNYDTGYKIVGDYELRPRPGKDLNCIFVGEVTAAMLAGGNSDCVAVLKEAQHVKIRTGGRNRVWAFWELWVEHSKLAVRRVGTALREAQARTGLAVIVFPSTGSQHRG
jgi:hypothetical protein